MLNKDTAKLVLERCLTTGADFAEIFFEDTYSGEIQMISGKVDSSSTKHLFGAGIRVLSGKEEAYGHTSDCSEAGLLALADKLSGSYSGKPLGIKFTLTPEKAEQKSVKIGRESRTVALDEKIAYLRIVDDAVEGYDERIVQRIVGMSDRTQYVTIANTNGKFISDVRNQQRISLSVVAKEGERSQSNGGTVGGNFDIDGYKEKDLVAFAEDLCHACIEMLNAPEMVGGVYPVIIHNGFGGVLFHEACGHSLEATSVAKNMSVFSGRLGEKIASDVVTAIDDGTVYNEWGSLNIDDEGNPTKKNVLIENGILKGYMIDDRNSRTMNMPSTGNARRQNYRYSPTSRMTNTYIQSGSSTFEEIIAATEYGLFAKSMGGGSVNPLTGEFNFAVNEGYMVEGGKITHPVRGATLIGNGATALMNVDMVADNCSFGHGVCGSKSGSVPANVGEPTIRIQNMTVGGNGGKAK
ncbi:MAG: TldD/PmbA family protein [Clostridia bacterium]|nr:TldD/PmbA family protein [Clostridia bacterium]MBQ8720063.1 TldD/PmbA family protein [Clostridia bacterium]